MQKRKPVKEKFRLLTEEEMIFGFGPKPTAEQLDEFFTRPDGKGMPLDKAFEQIRLNLIKRRIARETNR
jgi:hypothetical protein